MTRTTPTGARRRRSSRPRVHGPRDLRVNTLVVGSGAAALKAAITLHALGQEDVLIVTEAWGGGTSANAGSDKQTYYKLALSGDVADSARQMAEDLAAGGMHGDIALIEALNSTRAFCDLVALGVPFPHDAFGAYPGYRTDHDRRGRATSAGPLTSRYMVQALGREVRRRGIPVLDRHQVVRLLAQQGRIVGAVALALDQTGPRGDPVFVTIGAGSVVLATGGPGAMYADSVYPPDQRGDVGLALAVGATAQNLTESQFGLASIGVRWNLSGSYQQVVPRYFSTSAEGGDERDFLEEAFPDLPTLGSAIFRKGYQWPFDPRRVARHGSSLIDLLVHRERVWRGRRVFLDYTRNPSPGGRAFSLDLLQREARDYLVKSGAVGATPIERLRQLNQPAIELYRDHGIDLARQPLEIAVCAQHNNGGLAGNVWWESDVEGLFPVGEVNGSHGVYRPGGASLNAGQVGALRAATYIARRRASPARAGDDALDAVTDQVAATVDYGRRALCAPPSSGGGVAEVRREVQERMSRAAGILRSASVVREACRDAWALYARLREGAAARDVAELGEAFHNRSMALAHAVYLEAIDEYLAKGGRSRGSYVVADAAGDVACDALGPDWRFGLNAPGAYVDGHVLEVRVNDDLTVRKQWVPLRPIPDLDSWFENAWKAYRNDEVIR